MKVKVHNALLIAAYILVMLGGIFIYHSVEGWGYLDSAYFMVITATTIGYGDLTPLTDAGKIVTMIYSFIGMAFVFYLITLISHKVFEQRLDEKVRNIKEKKKIIKKLKKSVQKA